MAAAGTLLQDLDSTSGGDNDLVQRILSDMNAPSTPQTRPPPPPLPMQSQPQDQMMGSGNSHITMDSTIPTSHMIGNQHPSPADFAAAVAGSRSPDMPFNSMPIGQMPGMSGPGSGPAAPPSKSSLSWFSSLVLEEVKVPFMAGLLFFLFSLPPIRIVISHYIPSIVKQTGEYSLLGLAIVSLILSSSFWILQRVVAPLLSL
jgi:hypothetical protein